MSKAKIAVLIDWYLPGTKAGGPVRSVHSLVHLLKEHFDFYIITLNKDLGENEPYKDIKSDTLIAEGRLNYYYFSSGNLNSDQLLNLFAQIQPDLVYLNSFWSYPFSINIIKLQNKGRLNVPILLAPRGMLGKGALGLKSFKKQVYLSLAKLLGWYRRIPFHATQKQEAADILDKFKNAKIFTAPNINSSPASQNNTEKVPGKLKLFYLSRIARVKNLHMAIEALTSVPSDLEIEYDIYGNLEDKTYWSECEKLIEKLPGHVKVRYVKELPFHHVQETISKYHCLFLPTLNENFGHSIVESLLCGCPVIISDQTPWNDIEQNNAGFALSLSEPQRFTDVVAYFAQLDQQGFFEKSKMAIKYISNKFDLSAITGQYKTMFNECIKD